MKKSDHSYSSRNLHHRPDTNGRPPMPVPGKVSGIDGKIERVSKEIQLINARRDTLSPNPSSNKQFHSSKENDPRLTNRQPNVQTQPANEASKPRSRQFKLYTEVDLEDNKHKQRAEKLEQELQRKLSDSGFLGFFRTNNSSSFSHIDIYMELVNMEVMLNEKTKALFTLERRYSEAQKEIEMLLDCREKSEAKFRNHAEQIRMFNQMIDAMREKMDEKEKTTEKEKLQEKQEKYNQLKILFDDLQKQRVATIKKSKEVEDQLKKEREERQKERQRDKKQYEQTIEYHKQQIQQLTDRLSKREIEVKEISSANSELRQRCEVLSSQSQSLAASVNDLQEQLQTDQTNNMQMQLELESLRESLKDLQDDNQDLKGRVNELQEVKTKLHSEAQKKAEYKSLVTEHVAKEKKMQEKLQSMRQELKKAESQSQAIVSKLKAQIAAEKEQQKQLRESLTRFQYEAKMLVDDKKRLQDLVARLESDLNKQAKILENHQFQHDSTNQKLQSINEKKQSNERVKTVGRLKEVCARLRLYLPENFEHPQIKETDELDRTISQLCHIINGLVSEHLNPSRKHMEALTLSLKTMELEKECNEQSRMLELQNKEQAIRVLVKFVPEQSVKMVEEYISLLEASDCRSQTIGRKVALLESILKEADRSRNRRVTFQSQESTKRSIGDSHRKPTEHPNQPTTPAPTNFKRDRPANRDIVRKYFD